MDARESNPCRETAPPLLLFALIGGGGAAFGRLYGAVSDALAEAAR